jgi:hypothetical protein
LVETHFRTLEPVSPETAEALLALQGEVEGTEDGPALDRALVLALALSGQIEAAFDQKAATGEVLAELWRITQDRAPDNAFLLKAVLPTGAVSPGVPAKLGIARRLLALGFPDAAQLWIGPTAPSDSSEHRLLAAGAAFSRGDARSAMALLDGLSGAEAEMLRAQALLQLGDLAAAETALTAAGEVEDAARLGLWQGDWAQLNPSLPKPWLQLADLVRTGTPTEPSGLLGRSGRAVDASQASRAAIEALLASVASPSGG